MCIYNRRGGLAQWQEECKGSYAYVSRKFRQRFRQPIGTPDRDIL